MFSFPVMKSSFCFSSINIIAVPAASFVNDLRSLRTIKAVFVRKDLSCQIVHIRCISLLYPSYLLFVVVI